MTVYEARVTYRRLREKGCEDLCSPEDVAKMMRRRVRKAGPRENFWVIALDASNRVLSIQEFPGFYNQVPLDIKLIFQFLILVSCTAFVVCHNHPAGKLQPSLEDAAMTRRIQEAAQIMELSFHDHLILTDKGIYSFRQSGRL